MHMRYINEKLANQTAHLFQVSVELKTWTKTVCIYIEKNFIYQFVQKLLIESWVFPDCTLKAQYLNNGRGKSANVNHISLYRAFKNMI